MTFEPLAFRHQIKLVNFPHQWLPLIHLYDPDLPQYPLYYFHVLTNDESLHRRPRFVDRAYGYVERINYSDNDLYVTIVTNKNLDDSSVSANFSEPITEAIKERFGFNNPVTSTDVSSVFGSAYNPKTNDVMNELWERVPKNFYGDKLPFGKLWDEVLGLSRFVASWYSPNGRKSEFIQTHYFSSKFGEKIPSSHGFPSVDFFLLPTFSELTDTSDPLNYFLNFKSLIKVSEVFHSSHCNTPLSISSRGLVPSSLYVPSSSHSKVNITLSNFTLPSIPAPTTLVPASTARLNTVAILSILNSLPRLTQTEKDLAIECYNAFDKGPQRTIIYLMMLYDIRQGKLKPALLTSNDFQIIYTKLSSTYQSPKAIAIYAQQCFGNEHAVPMDTWVKSFFHYPLNIASTKDFGVNDYSKLFRHTLKIGKLERLIWYAAQARKVHSSACNDALWCIKYGSDDDSTRAANPLSCTICLDTIRDNCPAYDAIKGETIVFDASPSHRHTYNFNIVTDGTRFEKSEEYKGGNLVRVDEFSSKDSPNLFVPYSRLTGLSVTNVQDFITTFRR